MKRGATMALLTLLLLACGTAQAAEWVSLGKVKNKTADAYIDTSSIRVSGQSRRAWVKIVYTPHTMRDPERSGRWIDRIVTLYEYNCADETVRTLASTLHFSDSDSYTMKYATPDAWKPVAPDTLGRSNMEFLCSWKPK